MIIAFNFYEHYHYNKFYDFLVGYGYKDESVKCGPHIRISTKDRKILGYNTKSVPYSMESNKHIPKDIVVNLLKDNIAFNFETEETSNDFLMFLHSIGIKGHYPPSNYNNIRIDKSDIVSSMNVKYTSDIKMTDYIVDLNLNTPVMPTKEQILTAAAKCPQAEEVLKELFLDVFPTDKSVIVNDKFNDFICVREGGEFHHKGFYLSTKYNWTIENDNGSQVLVPWKKS